MPLSYGNFSFRDRYSRLNTYLDFVHPNLLGENVIIVPIVVSLVNWTCDVVVIRDYIK